jgi:hypothetical protein
VFSSRLFSPFVAVPRGRPRHSVNFPELAQFFAELGHVFGPCLVRLGFRVKKTKRRWGVGGHGWGTHVVHV